MTEGKKTHSRQAVYVKILAGILLLSLFLAGPGFAAASCILDFLSFFDSGNQIAFDMSGEFTKLPQFDEQRTEKLNKLLRYLSFSGYVSGPESRLTVYLDQDELFSLAETENNGSRQRILSADDSHRYILSEMATNESDGGSSEQLFAKIPGTVAEQAAIYNTLQSFSAFFAHLPELFPEQSGSAKILEKYKDYGTAVKKITIRLTSEDLSSCIQKYWKVFSAGNSCVDPTKMFFSGRQDVELLVTEEGRPLKIRYGGAAGISENDLRTVRLEWKTVRSETVDRDELTLRTPDSSGTKRNNLILEQLRRKTDDGETFFWKTETDDLSDGVRTRGAVQCDIQVDEEGTLTGSITDNTVIQGMTTGEELVFECSGNPENQYAGTLEIITKKDKIVRGGVKLNFRVSPIAGVSTADSLHDAAALTSYALSELTQQISEKVLKAFMKLAPEDLLFLTEEIPEASIRSIFPNAE